MSATSGHLFGDRYRLQRELGRGGMGSVWLSRDERLGRDVAVKVMSVGLADNPEARLRFEREAMAVARVSSPHIVQIYDFGTQPQTYMVMELLRGESLSERLQREGTLAPGAVTDIVTQCARGLATAHDAGIVHRDLKPGNIFIARERDRDLYKLVDFGLAKAFRGNATLAKITAAGEASGTPRYMSPEQLHAKEDQRDDVWSFAVIVYRCLSGGHPFEGPTMMDLVHSILNDAHTPITSRNRQLPTSLDPLFARAFHKDREARFQSVHELADALTASLDAKEESAIVPASAPALIRHAATMLSANEDGGVLTSPQLPPAPSSITNPTVVSPQRTIEQIPTIQPSDATAFADALASDGHARHRVATASTRTPSGCLRTFVTFVIAIPVGLIATYLGLRLVSRMASGETSLVTGMILAFVLVVIPAAAAVSLIARWVRHGKATRVATTQDEGNGR